MPPPPIPMMDYSFTVQMIMELKGSVGELKEAVTTLKTSVEKQGTTLEKVNLKIAFATGAILVIGLIFGWFFNKKFDDLVTLYNQKPAPAPAPASPPKT